MADGFSEAEAEREIRRQFGSLDLAKEECRDTRQLNLVNDLMRDVGFALRLFRKSPGFTLTSLASLVMGIGANVAMFQLFEAVRLRSLPVERPEELVSIRIRGEGRSGNFRGRNGQFTNSIWEEVQRHQSAFAGVFAYGDTPVNLAASGEMRNVEGLWVSGSFFPVLGVRPQLGRLLSAEDDRPGCGRPGVVISNAFWQGEFAADPAVLTRSVLIDGQATPILGVTPPEFFGVEVGRRFDIAMPICMASEADRRNRMFWFLTLMGRLRPDVPESQARAQLRAISAGVFQSTVPPFQNAQQELYKHMVLDLEPGSAGQSGFRESFAGPLTLLLCMVALVLLLACANLANMMLARATAREHEFAVRRSLGASRGRLVRQVLIESLLLALAGALLGTLASRPIGKAIVAMISTPRDPIHVALDWNWPLLAFAVAAAVAATVLFGLAPALRAGKADSRGASAGREKLAFRRVLLAAQVALCMLLLTSALLLSRSFRNLLHFSPGFDAHGIVVANVFLNSNYSPARRTAAIEELHQRVSAIPGVAGVARGSVIPVSGSGWDRGVRVGATEQSVDSNLSAVSEGYFRLMRMSLLAGRDFNSGDRKGAPQVAVVNQAFAQALFYGRNPVGQTFRLDGPEPPYEIVGLVGDSKYRTLAERYTPIAYLAATQRPVPDLRVRMFVRATNAPQNLIPARKSAVSGVDPGLTMRFVILQTQLEESVIREQLMAVLSGAFGMLGAMLALTGVFGVTAYVVSRRRREFGVRIALGATAGEIVRMILGEVGLVLSAGVVVGGILAAAAGSAASAILYRVKGSDPLTLLPVAALLGAGGLIAGFVPALRAARVAPVEALRVE
jgi:predicted permease